MMRIRTYRAGGHAPCSASGPRLWAMRLLAAIAIFLCSLSANAQRDIFNWELGLSAGLVNSSRALEVPDNLSRYTTALRLHRNLGRAWQLGLHVHQLDYGKGDQGFTFSGLSLAYNWDNGSILKQRAFVSPYHMIEGGYLARADYREFVTTEQYSAYAFENGLKFRLGDRISAKLGYALIWRVDDQDFSQGFERTFLDVWTAGISLHFGERKLRFKGPIFDASARFAGPAPSAAVRITPRLAILEMDPVTAQAIDPTPKSISPDSLEEVSVRVDTTYLYRVDTVYAVRYDTLYLDSAGVRRFDKGMPEEDYRALLDRLAYLEGYVNRDARKDTLMINTFAEERKDATQSRDESRSRPAEVRERAAQAAQSEAPDEAYKTDPALLEILKRQDDMIANQTALIRQMSQQSPTVNVQQPKRARINPQVSPTVMVPLNDGQRREDDARIAALEEQVKKLEGIVQASQAPPVVPRVTTSLETPARPWMIGETDTLKRAPVDSLAITPAQMEQMRDTQFLAERTKAIQQRADSIAAIGKSAPAQTPAVSAVEAPPADSTEPAAEHDGLKADYPAVLLFGLNKSTLDASYGQLLDQVADDLKRNPGHSATITGYTDRSGNADYNRQLSKKRAQHVKDALLSRGAKAAQLQIFGEGQAQAADKWSPGDRRVEVEIAIKK